MTQDVSSSRLLMTLGVAGAMAGLLLMQVHTLTEPVIQRHREERLQAAVLEVLAGAERFETRWVVDGALAAEPPEGDDDGTERVYVGYDAADRRVGVAVGGGSQGYQDRIELLFGYDPDTGRLLGMKVLESKETP
jgi:electron transport complex protein RnfG